MTLLTLRTLALTAMAAAALLSACGKKDNTDNAENAQEAPANLQDAFSAKGREQAALAALPQGDATTPLTAFKPWTSNNDVMFAYYALSGMPVNYEAILETYSQEYRRESDTFKKQDILNAMKPRIDQEIANAKANRYVRLVFDGFRVNNYDMDAKAFPQSMLDSGTLFGWSDYGRTYRVAFSNGDAFKMLHVPDETKARAIESLRSSYGRMNLVVYVFLQDADPSNMHVKTQVLHVALQDERGTELMAM